jgi:hypothetical protein
VLVLVAGVGPGRAEAPPDADGWTAFAANWTASGHEETLAMGARSASIVELSGPFVVTRGDGLSRGFFARSIAFVERGTLGVGRLVLTDENGDQIFNDLSGQGIGTGRRIEGTITGGTGRYADVQGDFRFDWQYVIHTDDGTIQGRADGLTGRYRRPPAASPGSTPGAQR